MLRERGVKVDYDDNGDMLIYFPLEDGLCLMYTLLERQDVLSGLTMDRLRETGAKTSYGVSLWSDKTDYHEAFMNIEADSHFNAVKLAMKRHKAKSMYHVNATTPEKSVSFYGVQMKGDTMSFAYCQIEL